MKTTEISSVEKTDSSCPRQPSKGKLEEKNGLGFPYILVGCWKMRLNAEGCATPTVRARRMDVRMSRSDE